MGAWEAEIASRERFSFGRNWQKFLENLDDLRIAASEEALREMLGVRNLEGMTFVDAGSGSGLSSLAAMRLGASRVCSFDFDPQSVECTRLLRQRYFPNATNWTVEEGSVLDTTFLTKVGTFDIVYSWGVLHHTGQMWLALENVSALTKNEGKLFIALYNDEGKISGMWKWIKKSYNRGTIRRWIICSIYFSWLVSRNFAIDIFVKRRNPRGRYTTDRKTRGMSFTRDVLDWLGGYPYEVAAPAEVFDFFKKKGFNLTKMKLVSRGHGNNEFVFSKCAE